MTETQLRVLVAVAETGGFSSGAAWLEISQPSASRAIASLEDELGVQLLVRSPGSVSLTNVGVRIFAHAREVLARTEAMRQLAGAATGGYEGRLRVGSPPGLGAVLAPMLGRFCMSNPAAEVELHEGADDALVDAIRRRALDVAVVARDADDLDVTALARTPLVVALGNDHALAETPAVALADLEAQPLILPRNGLEHLVLDVLRKGGPAPNVAFEVAETATALALAANGLGVVILPGLLAESRPLGTTVLELEPAVTIQLGLAIKPGDDAPPLARVFVAGPRASVSSRAARRP